MKIPLVGEDGICHLINPADIILYLQTNKSGQVRLYSESREYRPVQSVEEWSALLSTLDFVRVDRGTIVNMHKVHRLDPVLRLLEIHTENGGQVSIPVTAAAMRRLQEEMKKRPRI